MHGKPKNSLVAWQSLSPAGKQNTPPQAAAGYRPGTQEVSIAAIATYLAKAPVDALCRPNCT